MKFNVEIVCTDASRVTEEKLHGYILRAIAGVVANNGGIITSMYCTKSEKNVGELKENDEKCGIVECKNCEYMIQGDYIKSCTNNIVKSLIWHGEKTFDGNKPCPYYEPKKNRK